MSVAGSLRAVLAASRPFSWINTALPFLAAGLAVERSATPGLVLGTLYFLVPYNLLMYGVNDIFDYASDVANPRKQSIEGSLVPPDRRRLLWSAIVLANVPFLVVLAAIAGRAAAAALVLTAVVAVVYSAPPLRTKERPFLDSLTSACHFVLPAVCGFLVAGLAPSELPWMVLGGFLAWGVASHALGAIQDIAYDRAAGIGSIAVSLGARPTAIVSMAGYAVAVVTAATIGGPGWIAAASLALYWLLPIPVLARPDEAQARRAWRGFLGMNLLVGFLLTQLLLRSWGITTYSAAELAVGAAAGPAGFVLLTVLLTRWATRRRAPLLADAALPTLTIVVPCRDEATRLPAALLALAGQDYPAVELIVVDDGSGDGTADLAAVLLAESRRGGRVVRVGPKPPEWTGKGWAAATGARDASGELVLFVDADTVLEPNAGRVLVSELVAGRHDLLSAVTRYAMPTRSERALMPGFPLLLFGFLPLWLLARTGGRPAGLAFAYGPVLLARRDAYLATGGHAALPGSTREDIDLARTFARAGRRVGLVHGADLGATRHYETASAIRAAWRRIIYPYCGESPAIAVTELAGFTLAFLLPLVLPFVALAASDGSLPAASLVPLAVLLAARVALATTQRQPLATIVWHPVTTVATLAFQLAGMVHGLLGRPGDWRGRTLPLPELPGLVGDPR